MQKKEIQKRVLKNGKPLALSKFSWCEETKTFSSKEKSLVIDFTRVDYCTFKTGSYCTFKTGFNCTFKTGSYCTFDTSSYCTFDTYSDCIFKTGSDCTFKTGSYCTFNTGYGCTFKTCYGCTFKTGSDCTFDTGSSCTFNTDYDCVVVRRNIYDVIELEKGIEYKLFPYGSKGFTKDGIYKGKPHIIADNIVSEIISQKEDVYKVKNLGENKITYLVKKGNLYAHGKTIKECKERLIYKISDRDTSKYESMTLDTELTHEEVIEMYMVITGACSIGTEYFVNQNKDKVKDKYTIREVIELTKGQYNFDKLVNFFNK